MDSTDKLLGPQFGFWEGIGTCGVIFVLLEYRYIIMPRILDVSRLDVSI